MKTSTSPVADLRVLQPLVARLHLAVDADDPLGAAGLQRLEGRRIRIGQALGDAVMVAQVDEEDSAMVADAVAPAGQATVSPTWAGVKAPQVWLR
jgi:hypothetical protein